MTTLLGITNSFGKVAERLLHKTTGLRLSESTVERITETAGERLGKRLQQGEVFGPKKPWQWNKDAEGKTCAYVSVDMTGIMMQELNHFPVEMVDWHDAQEFVKAVNQMVKKDETRKPAESIACRRRNHGNMPAAAGQ